MESVKVDIEKAAYYGIQANNKKVLIWSLKDKVEELKRGGMVHFNPDLPLLQITIPPCRHSVTYRSFEEIPEESVPCSCGNPNHWFIKYTDAPA